MTPEQEEQMQEIFNEAARLYQEKGVDGLADPAFKAKLEALNESWPGWKRSPAFMRAAIEYAKKLGIEV